MAFTASTLPSESEEVWRYTPIDQLKLDEFSPSVGGEGEVSEAARVLLAAVTASVGEVSGSVLVHNGVPVEWSNAGGDLLSFGGIEAVASAQNLVGPVQDGGDALVRLNDAFMPDAVLIDVPAGAVVPHPVLIVHWCSGSAVFPRTAVRVGVNGQASVIEVFAGPAGETRSLVVPVTELQAAEGASLSYASLQILNDAAWSIAPGREGCCRQQRADIHGWTRGRLRPSADRRIWCWEGCPQ